MLWAHEALLEPPQGLIYTNALFAMNNDTTLFPPFPAACTRKSARRSTRAI
jgi:hypothetical protein